MRTLARLRAAVPVFAAALVLGGCVSPRMEITGDPVTVSKLAEADAYIQKKILAANQKADQIVEFGQLARGGALIGGIGLGAAGLAGLHTDAAVGFATLAALSLSAAPLAAPPSWITVCDEAITALSCLGGMAGPLAGSFTALESQMNAAKTIAGGFSALAAGSSSPKYPDAAAASNALEVSIQNAKATLDREDALAKLFFKDARRIVLKLSDVLSRQQPSVGAFHLAGTSIATQVTGVSDALKAKAAASAAAAAAAPAAPARPPPAGAPAAPAPPDPYAERLVAFAGKANVARTNLDLALKAVADIAADARKTATCVDLLTGSAAALVFYPDPPADGIQLGAGREEILVVSGSSARIFGDWIGARPPSDVLVATSSLRASGSEFVFKQLKKDTAGHTYRFLVTDGATVPTHREVKLVLPKE